MSKWKLVPVEPTQAMIDATNSVPEGAGYLSCVRAYRAMLDAAPVPAADDCESVCDAYAAENQQFGEQLARLRAENERLKADAARYRWMRADRDWDALHDAAIDAAIDAAMAQGKV